MQEEIHLRVVRIRQEEVITRATQGITITLEAEVQEVLRLAQTLVLAAAVEPLHLRVLVAITPLLEAQGVLAVILVAQEVAEAVVDVLLAEAEEGKLIQIDSYLFN